MSEISNYAVRVESGPDGGNGGVRIIISCFSEEDKMLAQLRFYDEGMEIPVSSATENYITLTFPVSRYAEVVDLLRHESPVFALWNPNKQSGYISTALEPVGEGE